MPFWKVIDHLLCIWCEVMITKTLNNAYLFLNLKKEPVIQDQYDDYLNTF